MNPFMPIISLKLKEHPLHKKIIEKYETDLRKLIMKIKDLELEDGILSKTNDSPYASLNTFGLVP